ncbi:MAG: hypothetical protein ETSY1_05215 [Candidatus Entotheonella factor]|uniref:Uncharacterized protein n=1 Tax=Entotheonella factor TaxID=1429438 RepID=W4LVQ1_ENTF1|nr:MAG: hypothetical protein ETSY1_05215 [Candidatus Entotheonella factor]
MANLLYKVPNLSTYGPLQHGEGLKISWRFAGDFMGQAEPSHL